MNTQPLSDLRESVCELIINKWDAEGRDIAEPKIEDVCERWHGSSPIVSNLIRCATERDFQISIEAESGSVYITEPSGDLPGNINMLNLLFEHFNAIQADAYEHLLLLLNDYGLDDKPKASIGGAEPSSTAH